MDPQNLEEVMSKDEENNIHAEIVTKKTNQTLRFDLIIKFFQKMASLRGVKKGNYSREFLKTIFKCSR